VDYAEDLSRGTGAAEDDDVRVSGVKEHGLLRQIGAAVPNRLQSSQEAKNGEKPIFCPGRGGGVNLSMEIADDLRNVEQSFSRELVTRLH
jgi:hypothetical protein